MYFEILLGAIKMVSSQEKKDKQKELAKESLKTQRAREKLRKRLSEMDTKFTKEALHQKTVEIHRWISKHADSRIPLKEKSISLFDENQNAVDTSIRIAKIAKRLQEGSSD